MCDSGDSRVKSVPAYPWEKIEHGQRYSQFVIDNSRPDLFDPERVAYIAKVVERYINTHVSKVWNKKVQISNFTPFTVAERTEQNLVALDLYPQAIGAVIPIYLINDIETLPPNSAYAVHGNVTGSPLTNGNIPSSFNNPPPLTPGQPFIVIPAGPAGALSNGNGINGQVRDNTADPSLGPTDPYQCFALTLAHQVIEVIININSCTYIGIGEPLGFSREQLFYIQEAVAPFAQGLDNLFAFEGFSMPNFATPSYFAPYNKSCVYDFLGNGQAPFKPYKGKQFFIYQKALSPTNVGELSVGNFVSPPGSPDNIIFVDGGSIYEYEGFGTITMDKADNSDRIKDVQFRIAQMALEKAAKGTAIGIWPGFQLGWSHIQAAIARNNLKVTPRTIKNAHSSSCKCKKHGNGMLPWQYYDSDLNLVLTRFYVINYIPSVLPPGDLRNPLDAVTEYVNTKFGAYYDLGVNIKLYGPDNLPKFDGSFVPIFLPSESMYKDGPGSLTGTIIENNSPGLAGPLLSELLNGVPSLPLGTPYIILGQNLFNPAVEVVVNTPVPMGPYAARLSSFGPSVTTPFIGKIVAANPLNAVAPLLNAAELKGNIALVQRGAIFFSDKVKNCQDAGAIAVIIFDNRPEPIFSPAPGPGAELITIPSCFISQADGLAILNALTPATTGGIQPAPLSPGTITPPKIQNLTGGMSFCINWVLVNPSNSFYTVVSNPKVDKAVVFPIKCMCPTNAFNVTQHIKTYADGELGFKMAAFVLPDYFVPYLRNSIYDNVGQVYKPLIPCSAGCNDFALYQIQGHPIQNSNVVGNFGATPSGLNINFLPDDGLSIFDPNAPGPLGAPSVPIETVPEVAAIYAKLQAANPPV